MHRARLLFIPLMLVPCAAWPQGNPLGPEFLVNTYITNSQRYPAVAVGGPGDFVVVWESSFQDGAAYGIFGQRYSGSGAPLGPEFRVNTFTLSQQRRPAVAVDAAGNFVVVWQSLGPDGSGYGVSGQRFVGSGVPLGTEFRVNTYTTSDQRAPAISADGLGNFMVVWESVDGSGTGVFGQRFTAGAPLGPEFRVNTQTAGEQVKPSVASDSSGNFVVVWERYGGQGILGQRFSSSGAPLGSEFIISLACLPCSNRSPAVASDSAGDFVVVWVDNLPYGGSNNWIVGRRFASSGAPLGNAFRVNSYATNYQIDPAIAADASGNFVVVWQSPGQDGSGYGIFGQRFASSGALEGPEFRVNTYTTLGQDQPAVAADALGNFVVTWMSAGQDGSGHGIFAQRYNRIVPVELMHFRVE